MKLFVAGVNYRTAPVEVREQFAVTPPRLLEQTRRLQVEGELDEVVLLSTCNRVEIYGATRYEARSLDSLSKAVGCSEHDLRLHGYVIENVEAVRHLFRVASGLDSMVVGETEITGQVKTAYEAARAAHLTGRMLNRVFQKAFQTVKETRTQTSIGRGATSVGSVAVELAERIFHDDLSQQKVMIIGAGRMGETCIRHLAKNGARSILVSNRSFERAVELAREFGGEAVRFEECLQTMTDVDIVVAAAGCPNTLLHRVDVENLMRRRKNRLLFLIDIAVPRNIDAGVHSLEGVYLYNIDTLESLVRENVRFRQQDLAKCDQIIDAGVSALMARLSLEIEKPQSFLQICLPFVPKPIIAAGTF
ncbi:MAG: Glutamyl-tRNA reductase [Verrucomicrobiales bacterium]|nr:Glutamyl-tRNA reductase [Verrucomicrobiales bacterium]